MAGVVVCGGGVCGLATAMLLARDGHEVVVLERDPAAPPPPREAWETWERRGVNQFRLPHFLLPRFNAVAGVELPDIPAGLIEAGAYTFNMAEVASGGAFPADPRFDVVTARRPVLEAVTAAVAEDTPGVTVRRGVGVAGLRSGPSVVAGVPHVTGVETEAGEVIAADLVVDATGRRSPLPRWLDALGARPPLVEEEESGFVYYGFHVQSRDGRPVIPGPSYSRFGSVALLALPGDNGTAGVGVVTSSRDAALRGLRRDDAWRRVVAILPGGEPILAAEQISPLVSLSKLENRWRRYSRDGTPCATGVVAVADSFAATNPTLGRGISLGLMHAVALRDTVRKEGLDRPLELVESFDAVTEADFSPWYRSTVGMDRFADETIAASMEGRPVDYDREPVWRDWLRLPVVGQADPLLVMPRVLGAMALLDELPEDVVADPSIQVLLQSSDAPPPQLPGPTRAEVLAAVAG